jgi:hypothetical protein
MNVNINEPYEIHVLLTVRGVRLYHQDLRSRAGVKASSSLIAKMQSTIMQIQLRRSRCPCAS